MTDPEIDRLLALEAEATPPEMVCAKCGSPAEFIVSEGAYRHKGKPHEDQYFGQTFCDRYGYPIPVVAAFHWARSAGYAATAVENFMHMENLKPTDHYYSYDLYNTETEEVEATENHTATEIAERNNILRANGEPQRWIAMPRDE